MPDAKKRRVRLTSHPFIWSDDVSDGMVIVVILYKDFGGRALLHKYFYKAMVHILPYPTMEGMHHGRNGDTEEVYKKLV